jgi:hypothetical protein
MRPLSPVHVTAAQASDGLQIAWIRRTRIGGDGGWEAADVPLGEDYERYEIDIMDAGTVVRTLSSTAPAVLYTTAQQITDFGVPRTTYVLRIYQLSASYGRGQAREVLLP